MNRCFIFLLVTGICITSCRTGKKDDPTNGEVKASELPSRLDASAFKYETMSADMKISYESDNSSTSFKGDLRIKKDSALWLSITPSIISIEIARVLVTLDSIKILDRFNKKYYPRHINYLETNYGIPASFDYLQKLVNGNLIWFNNKSLSTIETAGKFKVSSEQEQLKSEADVNEVPLMTFLKLTDLANGNWLTSTFESYELTGNMNFATIRHLEAMGQTSFTADTEFSDVEINIPLTFPFQVSSKYEIVH